MTNKGKIEVGPILFALVDRSCVELLRPIISSIYYSGKREVELMILGKELVASSEVFGFRLNTLYCIFSNETAVKKQNARSKLLIWLGRQSDEIPVRDGVTLISTESKSRYGFSRLLNWQKTRRRLADLETSYLANKQAAKKVLLERLPQTVVVRSDRSHAILGVMSSCRELGIRVVVVPLVVPALPSDLMSTRRISAHYPPYNFRKRFPSQVFRDLKTGKFVSFYTVLEAKAMKKAGVLPKSPWLLGGGNNCELLVDCQWYKKEAIRFGASESKVHVTGSIEYDRLYRRKMKNLQIRQALDKRYHFDVGKPLTIVALPVYYEQGMISKDESVALNEQICSAACSNAENVLVSLHPKMTLENYSYLEKINNLQISRDRLSSILPAADIFTTNLFSTTILWGILCAVPTVIFEFSNNKEVEYQYMKLWKTILGVVESVEELSLVLGKLNQSDSLRSSAADSLVGLGKGVAPFDGKAIGRIINLISVAKNA